MDFSQAQNQNVQILVGYLESRSVGGIPAEMAGTELVFCPKDKLEDCEIHFRTSTGSLLRHKPFDTNGSNYYKDKDKPCGVFHECAAREKIFAVTEGVYDALSLTLAGLPALALLGTGNRYFYEFLDAFTSRECVILLCMDNDEAGRTASAKLQNKLAEKGFPNVYDITGTLCPANELGLKDPNDFLKHSDEEFESNVNLIKAEAEKVLLNQPSQLDTVTELPPTLDQTFDSILNGMESSEALPTGIQELDKTLHGGIRDNSFVTLVGAPGAGKTAFLLALLDSFVQQNRKVFYCTYDMAKSEMLQRMISLQSFRRAPEKAIPYSTLSAGMQKLSETKQTAVADALHTLKENIFPHVTLLNAEDALFAEDLERMAKHCFTHGMKAVFLIDYLQLLRSQRYAQDSKTNIENVSAILHRIAKTYSSPVLAISETGKQYYSNDKAKAKLTKGHFQSSFDLGAPKESGKIEFSSDICLAIESHPADSSKGVITLLKNRYGRKTSLWVEYQLAYGFFGLSGGSFASSSKSPGSSLSQLKDFKQRF